MTQDITLGFANAIDIEQLLKLEEKCFSCDLLTRRQFRHFLKAPSAIILIAKEKHRLIASALVVFRKNSKKARIYSLAVDPNYHGRGIAKQVCELIDHECRLRKAEQILIEVRVDNERAIKFYHKEGYEKFGVYEKFYSDGHDALRMFKSL